MIIPVPLGEQYFIFPENTSEKEIKKTILSKRDLMYKIVSIALSSVGIILWIVTKTSLSDLYDDFDKSLPFMYEIAPWTSVFLGVIFYAVLQKIKDTDVDYVSSKTHNGKLKITPILSHKNDIYIVGMIAVAIAVIIMTFVMPIVSLTSSI